MSQDQPNNKYEIPEFCHIKVSIGGQVQPKPIVIRLHREACPKTCRNFVALCTNEERTSPQRPIATYCGTYFHRIIPNFMCQAGDFERFDGTGGYSPIYQGGRFQDENLTGKHDQEGVVSMANAGKNTNKSQFFITLKATPHLDGKHVVFGQVVSGMESVHAMTMVEREGDRPVPLQRIVISDCGIGTGKDAKDEKDKDESDLKQSKKKRKKHSKSKRHDKDENDARHRKKRKKHRRSHHDSSSDSSSSNSSRDDSRDGHHSRHHKRHRSKSDDGRKKDKRKRSSSKRKSRTSSDSPSSNDSRSSSSDSRDRQRDHEQGRKHKRKSRH